MAVLLGATNAVLQLVIWALYDGRAPSFDYAIAGHGGEGAAARAAFAATSYDEKAALRVYLMSLRRSPRVIVP